MTLEVTHLTYQERLQRVSFTAQPGELVGVLGANGAGKSTLLQLLCGLLKPTAGAVSFAGSEVSQMPAIAQRQLLGYLPQAPNIEAAISVEHFLRAGMVNLQLKSPEAELQRVVQTLTIETLLGRGVHQLSGGEQRRVHLARALLGDQPWLICDEPTASLDLYYQLQVMAILREQAVQGKLVTIAMHDLGLAARYCDRLLLLDRGALLAQGSLTAVLSDANLAQAYKIKARWLCTEDGVTLLPSLLTDPES